MLCDKVLKGLFVSIAKPFDGLNKGDDLGRNLIQKDQKLDYVLSVQEIIPASIRS